MVKRALNKPQPWDADSLVINPLRTRHICVIQGLNAYRAVNTFNFGYKNQLVGDVHGNSYCLIWEPNKTNDCNIITKQNFRTLNLVVSKVTARLWKVNHTDV
jgi:hypothetical protein